MWNEEILLTTALGRKLYHEVAAALPVIDFHNHLAVADLAADRRFDDLCTLWVAPDHYKHRAMRICGIPERLISGDAAPDEKFRAWAATLPKLAGNPLYHWTQFELKRVFGIDAALSPATADAIRSRANELLATPEFSARKLLKRFNVVYSAPCAAPTDALDGFKSIPGTVPSFRGDELVFPTVESVRKLAAITGEKIDDYAGFRCAVMKRLDDFHAVGCRIADHALDDGFHYIPVDESAAAALFRRLLGGTLADAERPALASAILKMLMAEYAKRSWLLQLHIGAHRRTSTRLRRTLGMAGGFAGIGHTCDIDSLVTLLDDAECGTCGLPRTILYTLNPADHAAFAVLAGAFAGDGVPGKVQLGPAWWYCDHLEGMRDHFEKAAAYGVLSQFIGMTTDSRSLLSFVRHEYFRRAFCGWLGEKAERGEMPDDFETLRGLVRAVCFENAKTYIGVQL